MKTLFAVLIAASFVATSALAGKETGEYNCDQWKTQATCAADAQCFWFPGTFDKKGNVVKKAECKRL